ncbi:MAG: hypothetical protein ACTHJ3_00670 [Pararhizobium sp.]
MNQGITLKMGAADHSLTVGQVIIDLAACDRNQRYEARRTVIEHLKRTGYFGRKEQRKAHFRDRAQGVAA